MSCFYQHSTHTQTHTHYFYYYSFWLDREYGMSICVSKSVSRYNVVRLIPVTCLPSALFTHIFAFMPHKCREGQPYGIFKDAIERRIATRFDRMRLCVRCPCTACARCVSFACIQRRCGSLFKKKTKSNQTFHEIHIGRTDTTIT